MKQKMYNPKMVQFIKDVIADDECCSNHKITACERFSCEYGHQIKRLGSQKAMKSWLLGLALPLDYTHYDISLLLNSWYSGLDDTEVSEVQDVFYWESIANIILDLEL